MNSKINFLGLVGNTYAATKIVKGVACPLRHSRNLNKLLANALLTVGKVNPEGMNKDAQLMQQNVCQTPFLYYNLTNLILM